MKESQVTTPRLMYRGVGGKRKRTFENSYRSFGGQSPDDAVRVDLQEVGGPPDLGVGADLDAFLTVPHLLAMEVDVAEVQHAAEYLENRVLLLAREAQDLHGRQQRLEVLGVVLPVDVAAPALSTKRQVCIQQDLCLIGGRKTRTYLVEVKVLVGAKESVLVPELLIEPRKKLVEDVVVSLVRRLGHDPALLQEVLGDPAPDDDAAANEYELRKARVYE